MNAPLREPLIFDYSRAGRGATAQWVAEEPAVPVIPEALRRAEPPALPEASELDVVRHYTRLSQLNFSIDTHFYPLGSCTMKYNPKRLNEKVAAHAAGVPRLICIPWPRSEHSTGLRCPGYVMNFSRHLAGE